jgi:type II secretory pathway pseudopilin PulG
MNGRKNTAGKQNKGFSLITVIIAVSFIGILGLLVLYMALSNFQMKIIDLKGKDSFYTAERAIEEIRVGLQEDVGNSMSEAYIKVLETYDKDENSKDVVLDKQRQNDFVNEFIKKLANRLKKDSDQSKYNLDYLKKYLDMKINENETLIVTTPSNKEPVMTKDNKNGILLKNLKVIYVDPKGYASVIETDIRLGIPKVQFPTPSTLPDLMNMIVVAGKGIICEGGNTTISGSIYSGILQDINDNTILEKNPYTSIWVKSGANLDIQSGDKIVSAGEIYMEPNASFTSEAGVTLWAQGVKLSSAQVNLLGTTYLSDDLTIESGSGSRVTVQGEYYGYGYPESARSSLNNYMYDNPEKRWSDTALSSSIVINGKNTTLDLSGVRKIMLAGRSYIGTSKVKSVNGESNSNDVMMGESITVKGTQLLPSELIDASKLKNSEMEIKNPMSYSDYESSGLKQMNSVPLKMDVKVSELGNKSLNEIGIDSAKPVQKVFYSNNADEGYVYFYLNFKDSKASSDFMYDYYMNNSTVKTNLDKYLSFYFSGTNSGIQVKDMKNYIRYVTNGNVLSYEGGEATENGTTAKGNMAVATSPEVSQALLQEQTNYQNMWYALNRKMITSVDLLNKEVKDSDGLAHNEKKDTDRNVFDNMVNEKEMVQFLQEKHPDSLKEEFTADEDDGLQAIMVHNGKPSTFQIKNDDGTTSETTVSGKDKPLEITSAMADKLRLVVCTGDVIIKQGVHFQGIIMAKGRITLGAGASLESAPLEAARVFQAQMNKAEGENKKISPKSFFWEGDKYVLGNTNTSDETTDTGRVSDTYDLADCVTYENWRKE